MYRSLDPGRIVDTGEALQRRIGARFPDSSLGRVSAELLSVCREAAAIVDWLSRPHWPLRLLAGAGILAMVLAVIGGAASLKVIFSIPTWSELLQGLEAGINEIVFIGIAAFFLLTLEKRLKRRRALKAIHVLRSIAHIIDMHQLTKDPERVARPELRTPASPERKLTPFELTRYLDYCSEMLAIVSKIAALYVQNFDDPVTLAAVNEVEQLVAGLTRKIWQKIIILDRILAPDRAVTPGIG